MSVEPSEDLPVIETNGGGVVVLEQLANRYVVYVGAVSLTDMHGRNLQVETTSAPYRALRAHI